MRIENVMGGFTSSGESSYSMQLDVNGTTAVVDISAETYNQLSKLVGISEGRAPKMRDPVGHQDPPLGALGVSKPEREENIEDVFGAVPDDVLDDIKPTGLFSGEDTSSKPKKDHPYKDPDGLGLI